MANLYPYIDSGTWENHIPNIETYNRAPQSPQQVSNIQKSNEAAHSGVYSGKGIFLDHPDGDPWNAPNFRFNCTDFFPGSIVRPSTFTTLQVNKLYRFSCWVRTPSSNPIGTADVPICIAPMITKWATPASAPTGTRRSAFAGMPALVYVQTTVAGCTDQWVQISYTFRANPSSISDNAPLQFASVFCADTNMRGAVLMQVVHNAIVEAGTLNEGGVLYIDDIVFEEISECDLAFGTPAYTKTNETAVDANDGSITVNATGAFTKFYSLNGGPPQASNVFNNLPPGSYDVVVTDSNPIGTCSIELDNIIITEFDPGPPDPPAGQDIVIDLTPINEENFVTWFKTTSGNIGFDTISCTPNTKALANPYRKKKYFRRHTPIVALNEAFSFYINFTDAYNDPNFADFRLVIFNEQGVAQSDIGVLQKDLFEDGVTYNIYIESLTIAALTPGIYRLGIIRNTDGTFVFVSNQIEVMAIAKAREQSNRLQYRASYNVYKWRYTAVPNFLNTIRLRLYKIDQESEGELTQYRAVSTGILRNVAIELDRLHIFECYWFDDMALNAAESLAAHDFIMVNGKFYLPKNLTKGERAPHRNLNKGKIELYEQDYSMANRFGKLNNITIIGSDDPLLSIGNGYRLRIQ